MAEFSPKQDDDGERELYLPSDIYPDEFISTHHQSPTKNTPQFPSELTYMEDLAEQLASYALRERILSQQPSIPPPNAHQHFRPVHSLHNGFGPRGCAPFAAGRCVSGFGNGGFRPGSRQGYQFYHPVKPCPAQLDGFVHARTRASQMQQENPVRNRFVPFRVRNGMGTSGFARESGGTGVFLPRVFLSSEVSKKPMMKSAEQISPMRNAGKHAMAFQHPSADMDLPQDWTY